jgi:hypothetical protein
LLGALESGDPALPQGRTVETVGEDVLITARFKEW